MDILRTIREKHEAHARVAIDTSKLMLRDQCATLVVESAQVEAAAILAVAAHEFSLFAPLKQVSKKTVTEPDSNEFMKT